MKVIQQDMLEISKGILFHQVNCQGVMGGGIAASFARKWPKLEMDYKQYIAKCIENVHPDVVDHYKCEDGYVVCEGDLANGVMLGRTFLWPVPQPHRSYPNDLYIANIFGQGYVSHRYRMTSYDSTVNAFERIVNAKEDSPLALIMNSGLPLYFPYKMGCGLGGGDWQIYSAIIERYFPEAIICQK